MKTVIKNRYTSFYGKCAIWCCWSLMTCLLTIAQERKKQVQEFEIISRQSLAGDKAGKTGLTAGNDKAYYEVENRQGKLLYKIQANGVQATIPALSYVEVAKNANRIWVYGDSLDRHVVANAYISLYSGTGALIKSLGKVGSLPFSVSVADNGAMAFAGNTSKDTGRVSMTLSLYDANGNRLWQTDLPDASPAGLFTAADHQYIALSLYSSENRRSSIRYYSASGKLLFTDNSNRGVSGIEFLPSGKVVVCSGNGWRLFDMTAGFKLLQYGTIPGSPVGQYPVSHHPSKDIFFIVSTNGEAKKGYALSAYSALTGELLARSNFEGQPHWEPYRLCEVDPDGTIRLMTDKETVTVRMK